MTYRFGSFVLNSEPLTLEREGTLVPLPPRALEILLLLVEREGQIVSKEEIFRQIWPDTHVVESSLTKNISILRKAIDQPDAASVIENLAKRGYRFTPVLHQPPQPKPRWRWAWLLIPVIAATTLLYRTPPPPAPTMTEADKQILIGQHHYDRFDPVEIRKALQRFERAAALDPRSALAQAGIADSQLILTQFGQTDPRAAIPAARAAAARAMALDPKLPSAHISAGLIAATDLDWAKSRQLLNRALELDPQSAAAHRAFSLLHDFLGDFAASRRSAESSLALDPLSAWANFSAARNEYYDHQFPKALELFNELLDREPNFTLALYYRALTLAYLGRYSEAKRELRRTGLSQDLVATDEAWIDARAGNPKPAQDLLATRLAQWRANEIPASSVTLLAIAAGQLPVAMESVSAFANQKSAELLNLRCDPRLDPIRGEPAFSAIIAKFWPVTAR